MKPVNIKLRSISVISLFCAFCSSDLAAGPEGRSIVDVIQNCENILSRFNSKQDSCSTSQSFRPVKEKTTVTSKIRSASVSSNQGETIEVSVVNSETAKTLFDEMASQKHIPFKYLRVGCMARAHEMAQLLEKKGIVTGKIMASGKLKVKSGWWIFGEEIEWWYHIAPFVLVEKDGKSEPYVIDPSLFDRPVKVKEWIAAQTKHSSDSYASTDFYPRFFYRPQDDFDRKERENPFKMTTYNKEDLNDTRAKLAQYLKIQQKLK